MGTEPVVKEEQTARWAREAQTTIRRLLAKMVELAPEVDELQREGKGKTAENLSLPSSTRHPHPKPGRRKRKSRKKCGGQRGHQKHERPAFRGNDADGDRDLPSTAPQRLRVPHRCHPSYLARQPALHRSRGV